MGCVQGTCRDHCAALCCCRHHYQPSSIATDADADADGSFTAHDAASPQRLLPRALSGRGGLRGSAPVPSAGVCLRYASLTQRGQYPDSSHRANQDSFCVRTNFQANPDLHFFGVFDGHGQFGAECAEFVSDKLADILSGDAHLLENPAKAYLSAFVATNSALHDSEIDDSMSGTTAITVLVSGGTLYVANVGDSRAVAGVWNGDYVAAEDLSSDQTPYRKDEYERVKQCGARVLCVDQVEGIMDPRIQNWGDEEDGDGDPPRLWVQNGMYPGTAFTRSVGDSTAESIGVIAVPEVKMVNITQNHLFFVVASDGIFEFLSSQTVVNMVSRFSDPEDACSAIVAESYKLWLENENRTDDITVIVVQIKYLNDSDVATDGSFRMNKNSSRPGEVEAETHVVSKFRINHPGKRVSRNLQSCPADSALDPSSARVASSTASI